jgi:hypothetical protein
VIRVRYQDISSGSHHGTGLYGTAKRCPQGVTIYLVPGLTGWQRKAVIRRLRQEASRGCGPELPLPGLLVALAADRVRVAVKLTAAAVRLHPAATLLPTGLVAIGMMMLVLTSAGVRPAPAVAAGRAGARHAGSAVGTRNSAGDGTASFQAGDGTAGFQAADGTAGFHAADSVSRGGVGTGGFHAADGTAGFKVADGTAGFQAAASVSGGMQPGASDGMGPGGRGLVAGQRRLTTGRVRPRTARVCFGAMPGMATRRSHLACRQTRSSAGRRARPDSRPSSG